jgi:hypothetical protein
MRSENIPGSGILRGEFVPPGDKSISHRAVMFGAMALGESAFSHFLEAEDCLSTVGAFRAMGVEIELEPGTGKIRIQGKGLHGRPGSSSGFYPGKNLKPPLPATSLFRQDRCAASPIPLKRWVRKSRDVTREIICP